MHDECMAMQLPIECHRGLAVALLLLAIYQNGQHGNCTPTMFFLLGLCPTSIMPLFFVPYAYGSQLTSLANIAEDLQNQLGMPQTHSVLHAAATLTVLERAS